MARCGYTTCFIRAHALVYGDFAMGFPPAENEKMPVAVENGMLVAWELFEEEIYLSKDTVSRVELLLERELTEDLALNEGISLSANVYRVHFKDGKTGTLRLLADVAQFILKNVL